MNTLKQVINFYLLLISLPFASCYGQNRPETTNNGVKASKGTLNMDIFNANTAPQIDNNIRSIFQDKKGAYWFGSNGTGVYRYHEKKLTHFTKKDGLADNQVQSIQEDSLGNIWFGTGVFGVSKFDGRNFTTYTNKENLQLAIGNASDWKTKPNDLWFYAGSGVYRYNSKTLVYLPLNQTDTKQNPPNVLSRFAVYCILKDKKGNVWFGTQAQGVCRYDGKSFTWFTEKGLGGSAVLGLFEDSKGNIWFGNNGAGLFRYDGKSLINFTEEKGLVNNEFKVSGKNGPGTLARVYTINEDNYGNLWIGTVDAGVWKYDGNNLTNYTTKNGLTSEAINCIYKDRNDELWFGSDRDGIFKFDGKNFTKFEVR
jgi:ligand-binding sensor domain-containing protein